MCSRAVWFLDMHLFLACMLHMFNICSHPPTHTHTQGQHVALEVTPSGEVVATPMDAPADGAAGAGPRSPHKLKLKAPSALAGWAIGEDKFAPGVCVDTGSTWVHACCLRSPC
jgi:hypothetical protein